MSVFQQRPHRLHVLFQAGLMGILMILLPASQAATDSGKHNQPRLHSLARYTNRLIIRYRSTAIQPQKAAAVHRLGMTALLPMSYHHRLGSGAHVYQLPRKMQVSDARIVAQRIARDPNVLYAEPVHPMYLNSAPNDPLYPQQWGLGTAGGGIHIESAWAMTQGDPGIVVGVLDSGIRPEHVELKGRLVPGYDFVSDPQMAGDGDGRDSDPSDPGDYCMDPLVFSDWHGTHVAGIIGAATNNGQGIAGINPRSMILPVRVVGRCGGMEDDTIDGMRWAAGLSVPNVPDNLHPARVLNLSLGAPDVPTCSAEFQKAIDDVRARGVLVVVSAGNDRKDAATQMPANCRGVITVAAVDQNGNKADVKTADLDWGTNYGSVVTIAAPGVGILSTINSGDLDPGHDAYAAYDGTSMAAPQVAGILSLMLSVNPKLTPDQVTQLLIQSRRPFTAGANCSGICAAGLADAGLAVQQVKAFAQQNTPQVNAGSNQNVLTGNQVTLQGSAVSSSPIISWQWRQVGGPSVPLGNPGTASISFQAPGAPGILTFRLTVQDQTGLSASADVTVTVSSPPAGPLSLSTGGSRTVRAGSQVTLNSSVSVPSPVTIKSYQWQQVQGVPVALKGALTPALSFVAPAQAAILVFQLKVTDSLGRMATGQVTVTVNAPLTAQPPFNSLPGSKPPVTSPPATQPPANKPPVAQPPLAKPPVVTPPVTQPAVTGGAPGVNPGNPQTIRPGSLVILKGSGSAVPPAAIRSYHWVQIRGRPVHLIGAATAHPRFIAPRQPGGLAFRLTVTDNYGHRASAETSVRVMAPIALMFFGAPRVHIVASQNIRQGHPFTLQALAQPSLMGQIVSYQWVQIEGPVVALKNANSSTIRGVAPVLPSKTWTYLTFAVTAADSLGHDATASVRLRLVP